MKKIEVTAQGMTSLVGDYLMMPLMYLLQGNFSESPQRTHRWNNRRLDRDEARSLDATLMVSAAGVAGAAPRWQAFLPIFHIPLFGGWKEYVVVSPVVNQDIWYVGWVAGDLMGVSRIPQSGPVRVLRGSMTVQFFGLNEHGNQIMLEEQGCGQVGNACPSHKSLPLL